MLKYEILVLANSIFMFIARLACALVFAHFNHFDSFSWCVLTAFFYFIFILLVLIGRLVQKSFAKKDYFYNSYKKMIYRKQKIRAVLFKKISKIKFIEIRHYVWYLFQAEIVISLMVISYFSGWGWGFELYVLAITSFFYLNLRKYSPYVFIFPIVYYLIFVGTFLLSEPAIDRQARIIVYIINIIAAISSVFYSQIIMELGRVIRYVNDENRKMHLKKLASFDKLTDTYHKYSFLEIMNAKLEHNSDEDLITQASVIIIEISNLRRINEEFTTDLGNEVLKEFAYILRKHSENYEKYIARWSGNEFLIFIANEDELVVKNYIDEIKQDAMRNRFGVKGARVQIVYGLSHTVTFDYQITKFINEAYEELALNRDKLNYEKGDL